VPSVLIIGASAGIGRAVAAAFARRRHDLVLAGRDFPELQAVAADLHLRFGVNTSAHCLDILNFESTETALANCLPADDSLAGVVLTAGYLGDQARGEDDLNEAQEILDANLIGPVRTLNLLAQYLEATANSGATQKNAEGPKDKRASARQPFLCALASVAGDRGRQSNYLYGAAKAGLAAYLQGLRNRLYRSGIRVVTVKPGFVDTRMTYGKPKLFLVAKPEAVARSICNAIERGKDVVYVPWFWKYIMLVVRAIPERVFKKMRM